MWRVILVYVFICLFGITIVTKVALIQFKEGDIWRAKAKTLTTQYFTIEAMRGNIYDSEGSLLATSIPFYEIGIDVHTDYLKKLSDKDFRVKADSLATSLSTVVTDKTRAQYYHEILSARTQGDRYLQLAKGVSYKHMQQIRKFAILRWGRNRGGLVIIQNSKRENPFQYLALRTIGYDRKDAKPIGLEGAYDFYLDGTNGKRLMKKLAGGVWMPITDENEIEPEDGADVVSTIDINVQDVAENSLMYHLAKNNADHGCAVLMEVKTGAIKAIANLTRKDSGNYIESYNYAIGAATEPGSTFKLASLMAAIEDGYIDLDDTVHVGDGTCKFFDLTVKDSHRPEKSKLSVMEVFEQSSNVGVAKLINRFYQKDPQKFIDRLYRFNLNQSLKLSIPGEANPFIKTPDKNWSGTTLPWMAYGYELLLTPMQLLAFYNAVANNGVMVKPQFVKEIRRKNQSIKTMETEIINPSICSKSTIDKAKKMMEGVVQNGTGKNLKSSIFPIAGKTGTAQILVNGKYKVDQKSTYQASFIGYFPANDPKYSCIVVVSAPSAGEYYGGAVAAPVFKDIADKVYSMSLDMHKEINAVEPAFALSVPVVKPGYYKDIADVLSVLKVKGEPAKNNSHWAVASSSADSSTVKILSSKTEAELAKGIVPDVKGMSLQDVLFLFENKGLHVRVMGSGVVTKQSLEPGTRFTKGSTIELELT